MSPLDAVVPRRHEADRASALAERGIERQREFFGVPAANKCTRHLFAESLRRGFGKRSSAGKNEGGRVTRRVLRQECEATCVEDAGDTWVGAVLFFSGAKARGAFNRKTRPYNPFLSAAFFGGLRLRRFVMRAAVADHGDKGRGGSDQKETMVTTKQAQAAP